MSSELLGSAQNVLKGNLGGAWDITNGYQDAYTDLGIARRFGGSAAAYSLRDIGAMNGPVVEARRDVDGQSTDPEEDFSANQVQDGTLEKWVNGELEHTLPANVDTAEAAYGLRLLNNNYSGNIVKIRRSSDNSEQSFTEEELKNDTITDFINGGESLLYGICGQSNAVGRAENTDAGTRFDALDALSNRVFMWDRDTSAFVEFDFGVNQHFSDGSSSQFGPESELLRLAAEANPTKKIYVVKYAIGGSSLFNQWAAGLLYYNRFKNDYLNAVAAIQASNENVIHKGVLFAQGEKDSKGELGGGAQNYYESYQRDFIETLRTDLSLPNLPITLTLPSVKGTLGNTYYQLDIVNSAKTKLASEMNFVSTIDSSDFSFKTDNLHYDGSGQIEHGAQFFNKAIGTETSTGTGDGYVATLFDQVGSNDMVQATNDSQPKVIENAAFLTDGQSGRATMSFDGTDDFLQVTAKLANTTDSSIFTVSNANNTGAAKTLFSNRFGNSGMNLQYDNNENPKTTFLGGAGASTATSITNSGFLFSTTFIKDGDVPERYGNAIFGGNTTALTSYVTVTAESGKSTIGAQSSDNGLVFSGNISEVIIFATDQTDNRFKIESNLNNYYGIYNDENHIKGSVFPCTVESVITKADGTTTTANATEVTTNLKDSLELTYTAASTGTNIFTKYIFDNGVQGLLADLVNTDVLYVSYNIHSDTTDAADVSVALGGFASDDKADTVLLSNEVSSGASMHGFQSVALTRNSTTTTGGGSTAVAACLQFKTSGTTSTTLKITDIRVSRIARNGYIPTWYDQTKNGNDVSNASVGEQPAIVLNGGQCKDLNAKPVIRFDGTDDYLDRSTFTQGNLTLPNTNYVVLRNLVTSPSGDLKILDGKLSSGNGRNLFFSDLSASPSNALSFYNGITKNSSVAIDNNQFLMWARFDTNNSDLFKNSTNLLDDVDAGDHYMRGITIAANYNGAAHWINADYSEIVIYNSNQESETGIRDNLLTYYNIS